METKDFTMQKAAHILMLLRSAERAGIDVVIHVPSMVN
jgi:hypothetical protein